MFIMYPTPKTNKPSIKLTVFHNFDKLMLE